jgi:hypothetical protein
VARHAVVWRNGSVFDLGGLGGKTNNLAIVINNAGQIQKTNLPETIRASLQRRLRLGRPTAQQ